MSTPRKPKPRPKPEPNTTPAVVDARQLYTFDEAARRLRWRKHSRRQARRLGLRVTRFGSRDYVSGAELIRFFEHLAQRQEGQDRAE